MVNPIQAPCLSCNVALNECSSCSSNHLSTPLTINGLTIELNVWRANGRYLKVLRCDKLFRQIGLSFSPFEGISKQGSGQSKQSQEWQHPLTRQQRRCCKAIGEKTQKRATEAQKTKAQKRKQAKTEKCLSAETPGVVVEKSSKKTPKSCQKNTACRNPPSRPSRPSLILTLIMRVYYAVNKLMPISNCTSSRGGGY